MCAHLFPDSRLSLPPSLTGGPSLPHLHPEGGVAMATVLPRGRRQERRGEMGTPRKDAAPEGGTVSFNILRVY